MSKFKNRGVVQYNDTDDFVNGGRGSSRWVRNWKEDGEIVVFIHPTTGYWKRACHNINYVVKKKDGHKIGYTAITCWEDHQNRIATKRGLSQYCDCPVCLFQQTITNMINAGTLQPDEIVLRIGQGYSDIDKPIEVPARNISLDKDHKNSQSYMNSPVCKDMFVFGIVAPNELDKGVQLTQETTQLGLCVHTAIKQARESEGSAKGDPAITPYAFKWKYNKHAEPAKKYEAFPFRKQQVTPEIEEVLYGPGKETELKNEISIQPKDLLIFKKMLTESLVIDLDIDALFAAVNDELSGINLEDAPEEEPVETERQEVKRAMPPSRATKKPVPAPSRPQAGWPEGMIPCPHKTCGKPVSWSGKDMNCPHCGTVLTPCQYDDDQGYKCGQPITEEATDWKPGCIFCGGQYGDVYKQLGKQFSDDSLSSDGWAGYTDTKQVTKSVPARSAPSQTAIPDDDVPF